MVIKDIEKNIVARIITQLRSIDGSANYNNTMASDDVHSEFILITEVHNYPTLCIGGVSFGSSALFVRAAFEFPIEVEIFGYVKGTDDALDKALELLSDIRVALTTDEDLNRQITSPQYSADVGAMDDFGVVLFKISGTFMHYE